MPSNARLGVAALLCFPFLYGCGGGSNSPPVLSGKITYNNNPVTAGTITFHTADGKKSATAIRNDGSYVISDVPKGEVVVTVETETAKRAEKGPAEYKRPGGGKEGTMTSPMPDYAKGNTGSYVKIPAKYADPKKSDLKYTVTGGKRTKDFALTD